MLPRIDNDLRKRFYRLLMMESRTENPRLFIHQTSPVASIFDSKARHVCVQHALSTVFFAGGLLEIFLFA